MKRYRFIALAVFLAVFCILLAPACFAHPGSLDDDGGHNDTATGEYHYHHGYPAHEHIDLDGDGFPDCPYDFYDNVDHSRDSSVSYSTPVPTQAPEPVVPKEQYGLISAIVGIGFVALILLFVLVAVVVDDHNKNKDIENLKIKLTHAESINKRAKHFVSEYLSNLTEQEITGAPVGKYITKSREPIHTNGYFDEFNIYINPNSDVYHRYSCRYNIRGVEHNIKYTLYHKVYPCSVCSPKVDFTWTAACIEYEELLSDLGLPNNYIEPKHRINLFITPSSVLESGSASLPAIEPKTVIEEPKTVIEEPKTDFVYPRTAGSEPKPDFTELSEFYRAYIADAVKKSSCFSSVDYSPSKKELTLTFEKTGYTYKYFNITEKLFDEFIFADSLGEFYNQKIKHRYPSTIIY